MSEALRILAALVLFGLLVRGVMTCGESWEWTPAERRCECDPMPSHPGYWYFEMGYWYFEIEPNPPAEPLPLLPCEPDSEGEGVTI